MSIKEDKLKRLFASKLKNFEPSPPTELWNNINASLTSKESLTQKASTLRRTMLTVVGLAVAASIGLLIYMLPADIYFETEAQGKTANKEQIHTPSTTQRANEGKLEASSANPSSTTTITSVAKSKVLAKLENNGKSDLLLDQRNYDKEVDLRELVEPNRYIIETLPQNKEKAKELEESVVVKRTAKEMLDSRFLGRKGNIAKTEKQSGLHLSMHSSMLAVLESNVRELGGSNLLFSKAERSENFKEVFDSYQNEVKLEHRQPISFGLLVSKDITNRFALETGLVYTRLSSKTRSSDAVKMCESQKFDYLAVPINVNYKFVNWGKLDFYVTAGIMFHKDVNGTYTSSIKSLASLAGGMFPSDLAKTANLSSIEELTSIKKNIHQSNIQVSTHGNVGASYPIYEIVNLYTSVGVAHYFKAGNKHQTIYSDRRTHLDVNLGVRLSF